jgi:hypothetical protein
LDERSLVVVNVKAGEQILRVADKQYEMVLYHCHVVVVKYKDIQQEIEMVLLKLEQTNLLLKMHV